MMYMNGATGSRAKQPRAIVIDVFKIMSSLCGLWGRTSVASCSARLSSEDNLDGEKVNSKHSSYSHGPHA